MFYIIMYVDDISIWNSTLIDTNTNTEGEW